MESIRKEIQNWLELVARTIKNIPFDKEVDWFDVEDVYTGSHSDAETPTYDHMCQEVLNGDFEQAMRIIERYRGVKLTEDEYGFKKQLRQNSLMRN